MIETPTVGGNNIAGQKPYEFIGILIIMLKNYMNSYSFEHDD